MPSELRDLVPDYINQIPPDPCTGDPLRFRKDEAGYRVYSLGPDRWDDDGVRKEGLEDEEPREKNYDVVFRVRAMSKK